MDIIKYCAQKEKSNFKHFDFKNIKTSKLTQSEVHIKFCKDKIEVVRLPENGTDQIRLQFFLSCLQSLGSQDWDFEFIVDLGDLIETFDPHAPRLCFSKRYSNYNIIIPDAHIIQASKVSSNIKAIDTKFSEKLNKAIFAGSDTGLYRTAQENQRFQFCYNNRNSDLGDFYISQFAQIDKETLADFEHENFSNKFSSPQEQIKYKYIFNIYGNTTCWDRLPWALSSNSLVLNLKPKLNQIDQMSWYYYYFDLLNPLVNVDEHNWEATVKYLNDNTDLAESLNDRQKQLGNMLCDPNFHLNYLLNILDIYNQEYNK